MTHRRWVFTLNNPDEELQPATWPGCKFAIWQKERGEEGTPHYQGYLELDTPRRLVWCRGIIPRAHWEPARGDQADCIRYCSKDDTRIEGPWEHGDRNWRKPGKRNDLEGMRKRIKEGATAHEISDEYFADYIRYHAGIDKVIAQQEPQRTWRSRLHLIWGPPGSGKSSLVRDLYGGSLYSHNSGHWWDHYCGQRTILLDDFDGSCLPFRTLLQLADRGPLQLERKGGMRSIAPYDIFIVSNKAPQDWYDATRIRVDALWRRVDTVMYLSYEEADSSYRVFDPEGPRQQWYTGN